MRAIDPLACHQDDGLRHPAVQGRPGAAILAPQGAASGSKRLCDVVKKGDSGFGGVRVIDGSQPLHRTFKQALRAILLLCFAGRVRRAHLQDTQGLIV
jgi:hypothetical protein